MRYGRAVVERTLGELGIVLGGHENQSGWRSAMCPFHEDASPSFGVLVAEGAWKCLAGCGENSDLAVLVERVSGEPSATARRRLLRGMTDDPDALRIALVKTAPHTEDREVEPLFYERDRVPQYLLDRGFDLGTLRAWRVGYDPLTNAAVIPIYQNNIIIGLIRRHIDSKPKYTYSYGLVKEQILFGIEHVAVTAKSVFLVEGSLDCIWLHKHGYAAVAILGSSLSEHQAAQVRRRFRKVTLAFDADAAGYLANKGARKQLAGLQISQIKLPEGIKDVQECDRDVLKKVLCSSDGEWYGQLIR